MPRKGTKPMLRSSTDDEEDERKGLGPSCRERVRSAESDGGRNKGTGSSSSKGPPQAKIKPTRAASPATKSSPPPAKSKPSTSKGSSSREGTPPWQVVARQKKQTDDGQGGPPPSKNTPRGDGEDETWGGWDDRGNSGGAKHYDYTSGPSKGSEKGRGKSKDKSGG